MRERCRKCKFRAKDKGRLHWHEVIAHNAKPTEYESARITTIGDFRLVQTDIVETLEEMGYHVREK